MVACNSSKSVLVPLEANAQKAAIEKEAEEVARQKAANDQAAAELVHRVKSGIDAGVAVARATLVADARKQAEADVALERRTDAERVNDLEGKLRESQQKELNFLKEQRELMEKVESVDLEVARRVQEETGGIRANAKKPADKEHHVKDKEAHEQNAALLRDYAVVRLPTLRRPLLAKIPLSPVEPDMRLAGCLVQ